MMPNKADTLGIGKVIRGWVQANNKILIGKILSGKEASAR